MNNVNIFTDGGSRGNPGVGAWAFVVYEGTLRKGSKSGSFDHVTNNEAELRAILEAMKWLDKFGIKQATIHTDSAYSLNGYTQWMHGWKRNFWKTAAGKPVKNKELWHDIYHLSKNLNITFIKVKAHSGIIGNEAADTLCNVRMDEVELNKRF